jgi:N-acetyl-anhydromuramyl-L-alanine amidase AmpD
MLAYRRAHSEPDATDLKITPRIIVLHYTAGGSAKGTKAYFDNTLMEKGRKQLYAAGKANVSAHFLVDRDGTIFRLMPEDQYARHCIGLNHNGIGVENVGDEDKFPLTDAQITANIALVKYLANKYPTITHLLGHHEVMTFTDSPMFLELDPAFRNQKPDPGPRFIKAVRAGLSSQLLGPDDKSRTPR